MQAASRSSAREEAERQLALWQDAGFAGHMDEARMLVYELLAGHVDHVIPQMQLDWRRALALHLWCASSLAKHKHGCTQPILLMHFSVLCTALMAQLLWCRKCSSVKVPLPAL